MCIYIKGVPVYHIYVQLDQLCCVSVQFPKIIEQIFFLIVIDSPLKIVKKKSPDDQISSEMNLINTNRKKCVQNFQMK